MSDKHKPLVSISNAAKKGLKYHQDFNRGGTEVGVARAHQLIDREPLSNEIIQKMYQYFKRHEVDKEAENFGNDDNPSAGYIAWLLWGGDDAFKWVKEILNKK